MELLEWMARGGHDRVLALQDEATGLRGWLALHHTRRGPAYGGIRVWRYRDETEALLDALRLSRTMTFKCVLAGVPGCGGKTVILADRLEDRPAAMKRLGEFIEELSGAYHCGPDAGFVESDERALNETTTHFAHHSRNLRPAGDATAEGVVYSIRAALRHASGDDSLQGRTIVVQGLGSVGLPLARRLLDAGSRVLGSETDPNRLEVAIGMGVESREPSTIFEEEADVFAPCAMGGVLHDLSIQKLKANIVVGAANNILARPSHAQMLAERGVLYLPDFVVNAGALIEGTGHERTGQTDFSAEIERIGATAESMLERSARESVTPRKAAIDMAHEILAAEESALPSGDAFEQD